MTDDTAFQLRFDISEVPALAHRYTYGSDDDVEALNVPVQQTGYLTREQLLLVGHWKSQRIRRHLVTNTDSLIRETTRLAFAAVHEELRISILQTLRGVGMPMASVLLHFFHKDGYPIIDFRALWSLNVPANLQYDSALWIRYTHVCRDLAGQAGVSMRELDRALWQFSKENQVRSTQSASCIRTQPHGPAA